ncbi:hypothetical protein [Solidesulfovibrio carbinoliphilus]|uniref:hypothetical protein n=1 Tax=Solidesulfovibrio carbinoliphilus TaxID=345370 RepID=UPI0012F4C9B9|nr:hypothetical protein [Solidesulfovibrio carbinoliphilus]
MASGLGKGLKNGELFKKTESFQASTKQELPLDNSADDGNHKTANAQTHKNAGVRKHIVLPEPLAERLRLYCFKRREKDARVVRAALELFLTKEGF